MAEAIRFLSLGVLGFLGAAAVSLICLACGGGADSSAVRSPESHPTATATATSPEATADRNAPPAPNASAPAPAPAPASTSEGWPFGPAPTAEERAALLERLKRDPGPIKSNWVPPGKNERYGHAEGLIPAPVDAVRAKLVDFAHYKDLAGPKFKSVRVVDKQGQNTDVYFQLPIMKGLITIWYVTRFPPARPAAGGGDVVEGTFVKGSIKGMHIVFKVTPGTDEKNSVLVCDLLLSTSLPAPQGAVDEELRDACGDAINAVKKQTSTTASP